MNTKSFKLLLLLIIVTISSCQRSQQKDLKKDANQPGSQIKIGLATGIGGLGDRAFNDMEYNGLIKAAKKWNLSYSYVVPADEKDAQNSIQKLILEKCNLIFAGGGYMMIDAVDSLASVYPEVRFVLLDDYCKKYYQNVSSVSFKQNEGSFLVGALAGMMTINNSVGIIAASHETVIEDFITGFNDGVAFVSKDVKINIDYLDDKKPDIDPYASSDLAKQVTLEMIDKQDVDIVYQICGGSGLGVFSACREKEIYAIGVDSDQDYLKQGTILTSMMKRLDLSILEMTDRFVNNALENKPYKMGLKENGVDLSPMTFTKDKIPNQILCKVKEIKQKIINNEISVGTSYE